MSGGLVAGALSTGWPENALQWTLLLLAAVLGGLAPHTRASGRLRRWLRDAPHTLRRRARTVLAAGLAIVLAAGTGRLLVATGPGAAGWLGVQLFGCPDPVTVRVLTTPDGLAATREIAAAFEADGAAQWHGCAAVDLYVYGQPAPVSHAGLTGGWSANQLSSLGPRPDVWLPGSSRYLLPDTATGPDRALRAAPARSIAATPLVLAVADLPAELSAQRNQLTWSRALAIARAAGWGLARPNPHLSVTGELGTLAVYASEGDPRRLDQPGAQDSLLDVAAARRVESWISSTLDAQRYPLEGDDVDLLCAHRAHRSAPTALIVAEQHLVRHNAGLPLGGDCPAPVAGPPPGTGLLAVYPVDTLRLDHPFVRLEWAGHSARQRAAARLFERWLGTAAGRDALNDAGLRPPSVEPRSPISEERGVLPGVAFAPAVRYTDAVLRHARAVLTAAQRPGRVLLALDASGSMDRDAGGGLSRFAVARGGVRDAMGRMGGRDEFGVSVFAGDGRRLRELVPSGRGDDPVGGRPRREAVDAALDGVDPRGNTPLYQAIADGVDVLSPGDPTRADALVVLTDGEDHGSRISADAMVAAVRDGGVRVFVRDGGVRVFVVAVGEASCRARALREVTRITAGACYQASFVDLDTRLDQLFGALWGGTGQ